VSSTEVELLLDIVEGYLLIVATFAVAEGSPSRFFYFYSSSLALSISSIKDKSRIIDLLFI
jgi:hypothetical protein